MKVKAVFFDFDATLFHTHNLSEITLKEVCDRLNLEFKYDEFKKLSGLPNVTKLEKVYPGNKEAIQLWNQLYDKKFYEQISYYDGILSMLEDIKSKGVKIVIYSTRPETLINLTIEKFKIGSLIDFVIGRLGKFELKPSPEGIYYYLNVEEIKKEESLIIGDSIIDYKSSINSGIKFAFASWGAKNPLLIKEYYAKLDEPEDILKIIK